MRNQKQLGWDSPAVAQGQRKVYRQHIRQLINFGPRRIVISSIVIGVMTLSVGLAFHLKSNSSLAHSPTNTNTATVMPAPAKVADAPQPQLSHGLSSTTQPLNNPLQDILNDWSANHQSNNWGVVVQGLGSDSRRANLNSTKSFGSASIYKLLLTYGLFQKTSKNQLASIKVDADGKSQTLDHCVDAMLRISDNPCGDGVGSWLGWDYADKQLSTIGLTATDLNSSVPATTAGDTALFLQKMNDGQLFDADTTNYLLGIMQNQTLRQGIPAGCSDCTVADKVGDLDKINNDAGIVSYSGGSYVLSIFTDGAPSSQIAQLTSRIQSYMSQAR